MNIVVIGPGAMGCFLAATLSCRQPAPATDQKIWLLDHDHDRAARLSRHGLLVEENGHRRRCPINATADPAVMNQADLLLLCVKSRDVPNALAQIGHHLPESSLLICLQNGISHLDLLQSFPGSVAVGITAQGAYLVGPGHVRHAGRGLTRLGFSLPPTPKTANLLARGAALLQDCGIETTVVDNILDHVWTKLMVNVGINALTAIHGCPNGRLLDNPETMLQQHAAVSEASAVAHANGIKLIGDPLALTIEVCRATADNISSMLQDVREKRPTEIEAINGAVVRLGRRLGIPVPVNEELLRQIKEMELGWHL